MEDFVNKRGQNYLRPQGGDRDYTQVVFDFYQITSSKQH